MFFAHLIPGIWVGKAPLVVGIVADNGRGARFHGVHNLIVRHVHDDQAHVLSRHFGVGVAHLTVQAHHVEFVAGVELAAGTEKILLLLLVRKLDEHHQILRLVLLPGCRFEPLGATIGQVSIHAAFGGGNRGSRGRSSCRSRLENRQVAQRLLVLLFHVVVEDFGGQRVQRLKTVEYIGRGYCPAHDGAERKHVPIGQGDVHLELLAFGLIAFNRAYWQTNPGKEIDYGLANQGRLHADDGHFFARHYAAAIDVAQHEAFEVLYLVILRGSGEVLFEHRPHLIRRLAGTRRSRSSRWGRSGRGGQRGGHRLLGLGRDRGRRLADGRGAGAGAGLQIFSYATQVELEAGLRAGLVLGREHFLGVEAGGEDGFYEQRRFAALAGILGHVAVELNQALVSLVALPLGPRLADGQALAIEVLHVQKQVLQVRRRHARRLLAILGERGQPERLVPLNELNQVVLLGRGQHGLGGFTQHGRPVGAVGVVAGQQVEHAAIFQGIAHGVQQARAQLIRVGGVVLAAAVAGGGTRLLGGEERTHQRVAAIVPGQGPVLGLVVARQDFAHVGARHRAQQRVQGLGRSGRGVGFHHAFGIHRRAQAGAVVAQAHVHVGKDGQLQVVLLQQALHHQTQLPGVELAQRSVGPVRYLVNQIGHGRFDFAVNLALAAGAVGDKGELPAREVALVQLGARTQVHLLGGRRGERVDGRDALALGGQPLAQLPERVAVLVLEVKAAGVVAAGVAPAFHRHLLAQRQPLGAEVGAGRDA